MAGRGKRQDPKDPAAQRRESAVEELSTRRMYPRKTRDSLTVLGLLRAVVVAAGVVAAGEAHRAHCPQERQPIYEPKRLP
ncbi:unnamed protein product [Ectocarpus sp. CCAP 1310/34]|nr:unnamed protein product [Ectocarpus sp. CCAP 1310/34]